MLRGIGRTHGSPPRRAQALATEEVQRLVATGDDGLVGLRDRALLLVAFAGALRRSELCGIEVEHITWKPRSLELLNARSTTDAEGDGARIGIPRGKAEVTCPVRALRAWLDAAGIEGGPVFRAVTRHNTIRLAGLSGEAMRLIVLKRARLAGIKDSRLEPVSPHGLRAGFVTSAYRALLPDEEIMGAQPAPQPGHHAQLRPPLQAQLRQPGGQSGPVTQHTGTPLIRDQRGGAEEWWQSRQVPDH